MADTQELVLWTLEQPCPLRTTPFSRDGALHQARWITERPNHLVSGIYLTSLTCFSHELSRQANPLYPNNGFATDEVFAAVGGLDGLRTLCDSCPANTYADGMAGCHGHLYQRPDSEETEEQLRAIIAREDLGAAIQAIFPDFRPLWRALWTTSPLPPSGIPVLRVLIGEMLAEDSLQSPGSRHLKDLERFLRALDLADCRALRLHVELLPLGHTEETYTVFPHCPLCKSLARGQGRFRRRYRDVLQTCPICGTEFSPARTASTKPDRYENDRLRKDLGDERFRQLALDFLVQSGEDSQAASLIVQAEERGHQERQLSIQAEHDVLHQETRFLAEHVYAGLTPLQSPADGCEERPETWPLDDTWLSAADMVVALIRAQDLAFVCTMLIHRGEWDEQDRCHYKVPFDPFQLLDCWQAEGCSERFHAIFQRASEVRCSAEVEAESKALTDEFIKLLWPERND